MELRVFSNKVRENHENNLFIVCHWINSQPKKYTYIYTYIIHLWKVFGR